MASVTFSAVTKAYGDATVVSGLDLELTDGSMTVLVGPSGCGKTTSLRMLAGLEKVSSGSIRIGDRDVTALEPKERDIAMVFQNYALYPHLSVRENIAFPLRAKRIPRAEALRRADDIAESLGLGKLVARKPKDLSGGQQQRVAIGRAIIREPSVFLFDEPLSNLDAKLRVETRTELLRLQRRLGITSLYVTHDQEEAMTLSDRIVVMRDGQIAQAAPPAEVYQRPADTFVATFVGSPKMNLITGAVAAGELRCESGLRIAVGGPDSAAVTIGVRPDDLTLSARADGAATVELVELLGPRAIVTVRAGGEQLTSVVTAAELADIAPGASVDLSARPADVHRFDPQTGVRL
ncbi:ABC transporter ATP-binding protein [Mycolicibacterium litorale]|uniref:Trehalose import ATP-binding protein SugC n=1 Tax=Mycolicibacterium litorale TaxID=758802 RepID=A0AAD1MT11_9MYCO|nr:ABC transporter ATP-binding protein [Mycolicibacterium litorale]MCV7415085.1 ABC transporter ATP-binding protein [Mycolicibacterium litorale]TDY08336.1 carbohydrate ABC transporter ATP-binding protein (CUT1 family) [Mycolicibacterium litorale]BBY16260.1 sugar ABC transporter ATP-binding protein [Mycolicibacterium litorale]